MALLRVGCYVHPALPSGAARLRATRGLPQQESQHRATSASGGVEPSPVYRRAALAAVATSWSAALITSLAARAAPLRPLLATLPAAYVESVRDVVSALSDTILFEAGGASEREVRRKADPAKASIERFLRDWKGSPLVSSQPSYAALVDALRQLGAFYAARGSRAALTPDVREAVLAALQQADAELSAAL